MARPSNWHDLDYSAQRAWEENERKHQREMQDAEYEAERAREDARLEQKAANARKEQLLLERDEFAEEAGEAMQALQEVREDLNEFRAWLKETAQEKAFDTWRKTRRETERS